MTGVVKNKKGGGVISGGEAATDYPSFFPAAAVIPNAVRNLKNDKNTI